MKLFLLKDTTSSLGALKAYLESEDIAKSSSMSDENRKRQFLIGRGALRYIAKKAYGIDRMLSISYGLKGKPYADQLKFSISHTEGAVGILVDPEHELGLDIQSMDSINQIEKALSRYSNERDLEYLSEKPDDQSKYKLWCIKEALGKLTGEGLQAPLKSFEIDHKSHNIINQQGEVFAAYQCLIYGEHMICSVTKKKVPIEIFEIQKTKIEKIKLSLV